jgi:hypothetical protein
MNISKFIGILGLLLTFSFFVPCQGSSQMTSNTGGVQTKPGTHAPVIIHSFAVDKAYYGYIWKVYIEAESPYGDMLKIASVVEQLGGGRYPTDWIYLKPQYQKHFKGYIQWNTFGGSYVGEWTQITLKVSVFDKAGNESNEVVFPFTFESGGMSVDQYTLPPPFDQGDNVKLGNISINLTQPFPPPIE